MEEGKKEKMDLGGSEKKTGSVEMCAESYGTAKRLEHGVVGMEGRGGREGGVSNGKQVDTHLVRVHGHHQHQVPRKKQRLVCKRRPRASSGQSNFLKN